ncbi:MULTISPECIES: SGNH/GDSL hydrolase family protein [Mesonia]|uniref:Cellulase/esterase CelE n=1 Tax=Mesonia oceanica TaxID=2687242 RepID=A0AC61Y949_9FLAO|nr:MULTISPECIES: SGNH/GDSL hydrolase family protein [Mesonia]MAN27498.1 GDSL family lipase [Mesonia sp.]MAQ40579.1 GDSL family lipase [Mesonia sp.]VVV01039.1 Cellulase/esterase CelE [Mesonia oceanica]|tara:strand:- start:1887 stop:3002 length:1116 start_codon:yes stop_codon:yes gene_type:complete
MRFRILLLLLSFLSSYSCKQNPQVSENPTAQFYTSTDSVFSYQGRLEAKPSNNTVNLISAASFVQFQAQGENLAIQLKAVAPQHAFAIVEVDGNPLDRYQISGDLATTIKLSLKGEDFHQVKVIKATEASTGDLYFLGAQANQIKALANTNDLKIEFIGNSITSGMGNDASDFPCGEGEWYDQHNAYWAYGPRVARGLQAKYMLSSVSGMGMYRNWNDEDQPVMPDVYRTLSLDGDTTQLRDFNQFQPDLISICLGTNDLSDGDGKKERQAFNAEKYEHNYSNFIKDLYKKYPSVKIALLTSPMIRKESEKGKMLLSSLKKIKAEFETHHILALYEFEDVYQQGCSYHPSKEDHAKMAQQLIPFYKELLNR